MSLCAGPCGIEILDSYSFEMDNESRFHHDDVRIHGPCVARDTLMISFYFLNIHFIHFLLSLLLFLILIPVNAVSEMMKVPFSFKNRIEFSIGL